MDMLEPQPDQKASIFMRFLLKITGSDESTLRLCPPQDWSNVRAIGELMLFTWLYQAALFAMVGHRIVAGAGELHPGILLVAMFLAAFILLIDSYMVMRSGWHLSGINELKRGGIDIGGGVAARVKAGLFLTIRILLSICLAQLTAVFLSLLIFGADVSAVLNEDYLHANAGLVTTASAQADAAVQRATAEVEADRQRVAELSGNVAQLRQDGIDPAAKDAQVQQAQRELTDALAAKSKADDALQAAQEFASGELGGVKGTGHSGRPGNGIRHKAALQAVADARSRDEAAARAVDMARSRLDAARRGQAAHGQELVQRAHDQLPAYDSELAAEQTRLAAAQARLDALTGNRNEAIRQAIESAPDHVARDSGLLAQIGALEHIANEDSKIKAVIILIDVVSFAFELAAVLAKVTSFVPTTYAALLARDAYLQAVRIANGMLAELGETPHEDEEPIPDFDGGKPEGDAFAPTVPETMPDPFGPERAAVKRPRGRPRKTALN